MQTWHIHIQGQVQGVGFRPFIYRLAHQFGLNGWVNNTLDGVHIRLNTDETGIRDFCQQVKYQAPPLARILSLQYHVIAPEPFASFQIMHSQSEGEPDLLLTPDVALCADCRTDIHDDRNRRSGYAFTTCINCGPRYSIVQSVPYDRVNTEMSAFEMCTACQQEYNNPSDRRYYSQTNSCAECGVTLTLWADGAPRDLSQTEIINAVTQAWADGQTVAIKGIGGYLLTCDAGNAEAVQRLRARKQRPTKPFALLFPNLSQLEQMAQVSPAAAQALTGAVSPIVLLPFKENAKARLAIDDIAPGLGQIGVMLPYTPLYELLLAAYGQPVVATSGNISNTPIVYQDETALHSLSEIADQILLNNRPIATPQDDSVLAFTPHHNRPIWMRRSRGLAPSYLETDIPWPNQTILATGAMLKSTFGLLHRQKTFLSQYLGDLEQYETQQHYQATYAHLTQTLAARPEVILADAHPQYPSTHFAQELSASEDIPLQLVQHHKAHFGAILGEHHLWDQEEPVLGLIWDGTGLGDDQQIWGGECFLYQDYQFERVTHFDYFSAILGDKMPKEPRVSALSATFGLPGAAACLQPLFSDTEWSLYNRMLDRHAGLQTSSVGRLFDAVAALLGLASHQTYEGEAATLLEQLARQHIAHERLPEPYDFHWQAGTPLPVKPVMAQILADQKQDFPNGAIAARFHHTLAQIAVTAATTLSVQHIACSGGVFQNGLLIDLLTDALPQGYTAYFHERLSPNDENIAFGQLICYLTGQRSAAIHTSLSKNTQPCA